MHLIHQTAYAFKNGQLVHISDVVSGLSCGCVCALCGGDLIAKKGKVKVHHFAHAKDTDCVGGAETALHILAKELFKEIKSINLPPYIFERERILKLRYLPVTHKETVAKGGVAKIREVDIEKVEDKFKPDVTLSCGEKKLFIEIAVTHKVDRNKLKLLRKHGLPALEICLEFSDALLSKEELRNKLQNNLASKHWLFHPEQRNAERMFYEKLRVAMRDIRKAKIRKPQVDFSRAALQTLPNEPMRRSSYSKVDLEEDRMRLEFFSKNGRQATESEISNLWASLNRKNYYPKR